MVVIDTTDKTKNTAQGAELGYRREAERKREREPAILRDVKKKSRIKMLVVWLGRIGWQQRILGQVSFGQLSVKSTNQTEPENSQGT